VAVCSAENLCWQGPKNPWSTAVLLFGFNFARDLQDSPFYDLNEKKGENIIRYNQERNLFQN